MQIPFSEQVTCTVRQFEQHSGLGHTKTYELIKTRRLKTTKVDGRRLINVASAMALLIRRSFSETGLLVGMARVERGDRGGGSPPRSSMRDPVYARRRPGQIEGEC